MPSKQDPKQTVFYRQLEQETTRTVYALATCNAQIGGEIIASLCDRFSLEEAAGIILVSLEQLLRLNAEAFVWSVEQLLPADILKAIRNVTRVAVSRQSIERGFALGEEFSVDGMQSSQP
ncbi:hypothetical protein [Stenomitos frigidus]|uniref:Uncharacterized protein n=1 Tax=Stenomitos frigidus ULC18 TaxID=2107698 RepID=A0A2T1EG79_9CYAN|nr:hypothetical protein [Stenomitos frigidus]PSB31739.1 hypothetical protein C7B82_06960 [Stenomitos frigidus ULC18]